MRILILSFFLAVSQLTFAQTATISGQVMDDGSSEGMVSTTVLLLSLPDSSIVTGALSEADGRFTLQTTQKGACLIKVSFRGYQPSITNLYIGDKNNTYDLGKLNLQHSSLELDVVNIESDAATVSGDLDKKTFAMDGSIAQAGGSALDAMKGLPGVSVNQEGKVLLRGSDKVAVLIDGKQSSLTGFGNQKGLDNLPASNIERIEIINNPSAKYDATGMAGIINIIYKKERQTGLNGEIGFTYGLGKLQKNRPDLPTELGSYSFTPKYIPHLNLNYKTKKVNVFLQSETLIRRQLPNNEFTTRYYDDGRITASQVAENRRQVQTIGKAGVDYYIDSKNTLSFYGILDYEKHTDTSQVPYIDLNSDAQYRYWHWRETEVTGYLNFGLNYEHLFPQPGHSLNLNAQFTRGWEDESYFLNDSSAIRISNDTTNILAIENVYLFNLDYVKPLKSGRIETGAQVRLRRLPVTYTVNRGPQSIIYQGLGDYSDWGENIYTGYANYLLEKPRYDVEAGLRVEYASVFYSLDPANTFYSQNDAYDYFQVYPNARFTFRPADRHLISLFYNRRVDRPGEPQLRVFPKFDDPELMKVGNPYVRPQFTQTVELAYKFIMDKASLFVSGYYRNIDAPFQRIYAIDSSAGSYNIINKIYANVGKGSEIGTEVLLTYAPAKWWKLNGSLNLYNQTIEAFTGTLLFPYERTFSIPKTTAFTYGFKINSIFLLPKAFRIQLSSQYEAPKLIPQGRQLSRYSLDMGIQKGFWNGKGELTLSASDIFNTNGLRQEITGEGFTAVYENYYETQAVRLGFRYKF